MPATFVARSSRGRLFLLAAIGAGFVSIGLWILGVFGNQPAVSPVKTFVAGWLGVPFFGLATLVAVKRMFTAGDVITVDQRGIRWQQWSDDFIPWMAITSVERRTLRRQQFLCLTLRDPRRYRSTSIMGRMAALNKSMGFGDIALTISQTDKTIDELADAIAHYRP